MRARLVLVAGYALLAATGSLNLGAPWVLAICALLWLTTLWVANHPARNK